MGKNTVKRTLLAISRNVGSDEGVVLSRCTIKPKRDLIATKPTKIIIPYPRGINCCPRENFPIINSASPRGSPAINELANPKLTRKTPKNKPHHTRREFKRGTPLNRQRNTATTRATAKKLITTRNIGATTNYLGKSILDEHFVWQDCVAI